MNFTFPRSDSRAATCSTTRANTFCFLQEPHPHLKPKILTGQRAHRTKIDGVQ